MSFIEPTTSLRIVQFYGCMEEDRPDKLQQAFTDSETGEITWEDIPIVKMDVRTGEILP